MKIAGYKKSNNNKTLIIAIVAVVAILAIVIGLILGLSGKSKEKSKGTSTTPTTQTTQTTTTTTLPTYANIVGISIETLPKTNYFVGDEFDPSGIVVKVEVDDATKNYFVDASNPDLTFTGFSSSSVRDSLKIYVDYKGYKTSFDVSVKSKPVVVEGTVTEIKVISTPKIIYDIGEEFDQSEIVIAVTVAEQTEPYYIKGSNAEVIVTGFDSSVANDELVLTVSYRECSTTYNVVVKDKASVPVVILGLTIVSKPQTTYYVNQPFDSTGMKLQVITDRQETQYFIDVNDPELTISGFDSSVAVENQVITLSYKGVTVTLKVTIKDYPTANPTLVSIEVCNLIDTYTVEKWNRNGLNLYGATLKLTYSDDSTEEVTLTSRYVSPISKVEGPGIIEITVTYNGKKITVPITITE